MNIQQERQRFEEYCRDIFATEDCDLRQDPERIDEWVPVAYVDETIDAQWLGWIARAEWSTAHRENADA